MTPQKQPAPPPRADDDAAPGRLGASGGSGARWAGGIVLALVLYVLSTGPAIRLAEAGYLSHETLWMIYGPIGRVLDTEFGAKYLEPPLIWYVTNIWGAKSL